MMGNFAPATYRTRR